MSIAKEILVAAGDVNSNVSIEEVEENVQRSRARADARSRRSSILYPVLVLASFLLLWEFLTDFLEVPTFLIPPPTVVAQSIATHWVIILHHSWVTTVEILFGYLLSIAVGVPLALAIFVWPPFARSIYPMLISSQAMPKVAVAPLLVVWFGFGLIPKVLIAFLVAFFPIVVNTVVGLESIEREKIYLARSMGFGPIATFFKIRLPNALPAIFGGLKIAATLSVVGAVVGEFVGGDAGLGYMLMTANGSMDTPLLFAGIFALTVLGVIFFLLVEAAERIFIPRHLINASSAGHESS